MVRAPLSLKRTFSVSSFSDSGSENNDGQDDNRIRRQRTGYSASSSLRASLRPSKPLSDKANRQHVSDPLLESSPTSTGQSTYKLGYTAQKNSINVETLKQKPSALQPKRPTRIPVKLKNSIRGSGVIKLEPTPPQPAAAPVLSLHSPLPGSLSLLSPKGPRASLDVAKDEPDMTHAPFDLDSLPSIPSPPASPPAFKGRNNQLTEEAIKTKNLSRTPSPPPSSMQGSLGYPSNAPKAHRHAPIRGPRKQGAKEAVKPTHRGSKAGEHEDDDIVHLNASDCQVFVSFAESPHYEVWDLPDDTLIPCPVQLYIMTRDPARWQGFPLHLPDVSHLSIDCRTKATSSRFSADQDKWSIKFTGAEVPSGDGKSPPLRLPHDSIAVEHKWDRVLTMPTVGKGCRDNVAAYNGMPPTSPLSLSASPDDSEDPVTPLHPVVPGRGFVMRFWVPVPTRLFLKKETRVFEISAKVWIDPEGQSRGLIGVIEDADLDAKSIGASTEMSVSHLRTEREMLTVV